MGKMYMNFAWSRFGRMRRHKICRLGSIREKIFEKIFLLTDEQMYDILNA